MKSKKDGGEIRRRLFRDQEKSRDKTVGLLYTHAQSRADLQGGTADLRGDAYARLGVVHTVVSRPDITASLDGGSLPVTLPTRHDTVGEAVAGARLTFGQAWSAFAEAGRSSRTDVVAGGWRASAGFRWRF